jgi:hypothetical protein
MARNECDDMRGATPISYWQEFVREYPPVAAEMEEWLERRHSLKRLTDEQYEENLMQHGVVR